MKKAMRIPQFRNSLFSLVAQSICLRWEDCLLRKVSVWRGFGHHIQAVFEHNPKWLGDTYFMMIH